MGFNLKRIVVILYNSKNNFIGIGKEELSFLGYSDISELKTYVNDVADLFVQKSGYVHKFKNFSWIDYVLHSGASTKTAIVRLKNGSEIEVKLDIKELMLCEPKDDEEMYYQVELKRAIDNLKISNLANSTDVKDEVMDFNLSVGSETFESKKINSTNLKSNPNQLNEEIIEVKAKKNRPIDQSQLHDKQSNQADLKDDDFLKEHALPTTKQAYAYEKNIKEVSAELGLSEEKIKDFIEQFFEYIKDENKRLESYILNKDLYNITSIIYPIKGLSDIFKFNSVSQVFVDFLNSDRSDLEGFWKNYNLQLQKIQDNKGE